MKFLLANFFGVLAAVTAVSVHYQPQQQVQYHQPAQYHQPQYEQPQLQYYGGQGGHKEEEHTTPKNYAFEYVVNDPHKHDFHTRKEERHNGVVKGSYSLIDTDGSKRTVEYTADPKTGFHAVVHTEPGVAPPAPAKAPAHHEQAYQHQPQYEHQSYQQPQYHYQH